MNHSIRHSEEICNRLREKFTNLIPEKYMRHIVSILIAFFCVGYRGKTVSIANHSKYHRTTISRFLRNEKWDDAPLAAAMKALVTSAIFEREMRL